MNADDAGRHVRVDVHPRRAREVGGDRPQFRGQCAHRFQENTEKALVEDTGEVQPPFFAFARFACAFAPCRLSSATSASRW